MIRVMTKEESEESLELNWAKLLQSKPGTLFDQGLKTWWLLYAVNDSESVQVVPISTPEEALRCLIDGNFPIIELKKNEVQCLNIRTN